MAGACTESTLEPGARDPTLNPLFAITGPVQQIEAGGYWANSGHTCGIGSDGTVSCWGYNLEGQTNAPGGTFVQVSAGGSHTCGLKTDGSLSCWGYPGYGITTPPAGTFTQVSAGRYHTCALRTDASVVCWGYPTVLAAPAGAFQQISAGNDITCGIQAGSIKCWGVDWQDTVS